jgi:hypothetical protein
VRSKEAAFFWVVGFSLLLTGCGADVGVAHKIGMSEARWYALSAKKQRQLKKSYQKNQKAKKKLVSKSGSETYRAVSLQIESGQARIVPGKSQEALAPTEVEMQPNSCRNIGLHALAAREGGQQKHYAELEVCYVHDRLYLDPNYRNDNYPLGTINIPVDDLLHQGVRLCGVQTQGAAQLRDACISARYTGKNKPSRLAVQPGKEKEGVYAMHEQEQKAKSAYWEEHSKKKKLSTKKEEKHEKS